MGRFQRLLGRGLRTRSSPPEERTKRAHETPRTRRLIGLDYEQDMPRVERPYANSGKPNSILSEDWRDLSCNQREAYLEHDKRRILERASKTRTDHERAIENNQESWRNVGNRTPRPDGVPEHFRVWARYDADASTMKGTRSGGPAAPARDQFCIESLDMPILEKKS